MVDRSKKIASFEQLEVWQKSQDLAIDLYKISKDFPPDEKFGLTNQLRRSAASVSANIAEGFGRGSKSEKIQFYRIAYGSLLETKSFIYLTARLHYLDGESKQGLIEHIDSCQKQINALIKSIQNHG